MADDPHALQKLAGFVNSVRSRELVTEKVVAPLRNHFAEDVVNAIEPEFQKLVYGEKADKGKKSRQTLLLGQPEHSPDAGPHACAHAGVRVDTWGEVQASRTRGIRDSAPRRFHSWWRRR